MSFTKLQPTTLPAFFMEDYLASFHQEAFLDVPVTFSFAAL